MSRLSKAAWTALALSLTTMLLGCQTTDSRDARIETKMPPRPSFMAPVAVPRYAKGQDARERLGVTKQALTKANKRLVDSADWYDDLRGMTAEK